MGERERYLRQLIELGERDVVVPESGKTGRREDGKQDESAPSREPLTAVPSDRVTPSRGPALYPPGLTVEAPPARDDLFTADPVARAERLEAIAELAATCTKCALGHTRQRSVPGEGDPRARLVCVGEAPGATEDQTGRPFVGRAGQLLTDILKAIGLAREDVFICNVLKCRPPDNRTPEPLEVAACSPYLHRQLELIRPKVILALGRPAANTLLGVTASLGDLRGRIHRYRGTALVVTYHPAALLRNPNWKAPTWDDVRIARRLLDDDTG